MHEEGESGLKQHRSDEIAKFSIFVVQCMTLAAVSFFVGAGLYVVIN